MIHPRKPQGRIPLHPFEPDQHILQRGVHGMPHMQLAGYIGGRHNNGKRLFVRIAPCVEIAALLPHLIDAALHLLRLINLG